MGLSAAGKALAAQWLKTLTGRDLIERLVQNPVFFTIMPRLQFDLPKTFRFSTEVQIYISHVNYGGHLDNAQLLTLVSEARMRFFKALGYHEGDVEGCAIVVGDLGAQYRSEGFHGEVMQIALEPTDFNKYGFDLVFNMQERNSGRDVARGKVGIVFIDPERKKPAPVPASFIDKVKQLG